MLYTEKMNIAPFDAPTKGMWSLGDFLDCFLAGHVRATLRIG